MRNDFVVKMLTAPTGLSSSCASDFDMHSPDYEFIWLSALALHILRQRKFRMVGKLILLGKRVPVIVLAFANKSVA